MGPNAGPNLYVGFSASDKNDSKSFFRDHYQYRRNEEYLAIYKIINDNIVSTFVSSTFL